MAKLSVLSSVLALPLVVVLIGCSISHETMRGSVVMKLEKEAHVCIGSEDGISVGDELTVYRTKQVPVTREPVVPDQRGKNYPRTKYEKVKVGRARVTAILNEHYAAIEVTEGELEMSDIVEVTRR